MKYEVFGKWAAHYFIGIKVPEASLFLKFYILHIHGSDFKSYYILYIHGIIDSVIIIANTYRINYVPGIILALYVYLII